MDIFVNSLNFSYIFIDSNLKKGKAPGSDRTSNKLTKDAAGIISKPLAIAFNITPKYSDFSNIGKLAGVFKSSSEKMDTSIDLSL